MEKNKYMDGRMGHGGRVCGIRGADSVCGEDSAKQIFDMGAVYYYLIDNSTYVEAPETEAETTEAENILEEKETAAEESESSSAAN